MTQPAFPVIFDPAQRRRARDRAYKQYADDTRFLHAWAQRHIQDRLADVTRSFTAPLILNSDALLDAQMDQEILNAAPASHDLILSNLWLHTINDLPGMLIQIKRALKPDGLFIGAMFGGETLRELRDVFQQTEMDISGGVSPRIFPFADKLQMAGLMQRAGFALPVVDSDIITVTYKDRDLRKLLHDIRAMGDTNLLAERSRRFMPRAFLDRANHLYGQKFSGDEGLHASFEIIFLLGWAPHDSQQKPLKPGSAQISLHDVLSNDETPP